MVVHFCVLIVNIQHIFQVREFFHKLKNKIGDRDEEVSK